MPDDDREQRIAEILNVGRATRRPLPSWIWAVAAAIAIVGAIGATLLLFARPKAPTKLPKIAPCVDAGGGLGVGIAFGVVGGAAVGYALGRVHSSRKSP